jgi:thioredoxin-like negative regulator of GroEL
MTPTGTKWGTTGAVIVVVAISLAAVDQFLARVESAEVRSSARRSYQTGSRLLNEGKAEQAISFLNDAHAQERQNPEYELQLIAALTAAGKTAEAESLVADILQREPNDGRANLIAARLANRKGSTAEAVAYYHRAIYGEWSGNPGTPRASARMELIDLLAGKHQKQELLAELISVGAEAQATRAVQKRLAALFVLADSPARAANVYETLVQKDPKDIEAYEGLGDAELEQGQYRAAHDVFLRAFMREPGNGSIRAHLLTLNTVTELDPTLRQLTSAEKYRRSVRVLEMTREVLDQCVTKSSHGSNASSDENMELLKLADAMIAGKTPAHVTNEAAEGVLSLAEKLWHGEMTICGRGSSNQNPLDLIMKKITG